MRHPLLLPQSGIVVPGIALALAMETERLRAEGALKPVEAVPDPQPYIPTKSPTDFWGAQGNRKARRDRRYNRG